MPLALAILAFHHGPRLRVPLPLVSAQVCAGFPSPADDHLEGEFDLNELFVRNPPATFLIRAAGESMSGPGAEIQDGDLLLVDRSVKARSGHIVIACLDGENTVKRLRKANNGRVWLEPENAAFPKIEISPERDFSVWGVVIARFRQYV